MNVEDYVEQVCRLDRRIDNKLERSARLRREGRLAEWAALEREIDRDVDALVDLKARQAAPRKEALL